MLPEDVSNEVQKRLGFSEDDFKSFLEAIKSEEDSEITLPEMHYFTPEEFDQFKQNTKKTKQPSWVEESIKEWKNEKGFDISGKSFDAIYEYGKNEGLKEGQKKPDERFNDLKGKYDSALSEIDNFKKQLEDKEREVFNNITKTKLTSKIDFNTTIKPEYIYTLYSQDFEPVTEEGNLRVRKKGAQDLLRDDRYNAFEADKHFMKFAESFKVKDSLNGSNGTNGGGNSTEPVFNSREDYNKWVLDNKPDMQTKSKVWLNSIKENPDLAEY